MDVEAVAPHDLGDVPDDHVRVLFRPPAEPSRYHRSRSTIMALAALRHLAWAGAILVYAPHDRRQLAYLEGLEWMHEPVILERAVPSVALLKSVDAVVCSGGTMLHEGAYLGIPAYGVSQSRVGGVDRQLEALGRATLLRHEEDLARTELRKRPGLDVLDQNPGLLDELVALVIARARAKTSSRATTGARTRPSAPSGRRGPGAA